MQIATPFLSPSALAQARESLLGRGSDALIETMALIALHQQPPQGSPDAVATAVKLGWLDGGRRLTTLGQLVGDSLREYRFWVQRKHTTHGESSHPATAVAAYRGKEVLEIGCGFGANLFAIATTAKRAVGLEPIEVYRQLSPILAERSKYPSVAVVDGFAERMPFDDASFDVVLSYSSYEYTDVQAAMKEAHRVLRPGGQIQLMSGTLQQFVKTMAQTFKSERSLGIIKYATEAVANTLVYQWTGRRLTQPRVAGMTMHPVYPSVSSMRHMLLTANFTLAPEWHCAVGEDTLFLAFKGS